MRLHFSNRLLASLAVAGALVGGALITPAAAQETDKKPTAVTISGTALNPDGSPAASLPVAVKAVEKQLAGPPGGDGGAGDGTPPPPDLLSQGAGQKGGAKGKGKGEGMLKTLGRGMTDESGRFAVKFTTVGQGDQTVLVEIGEPTKSNFARKTVVTKGADVDLGNVTLNARAGSQ